VAVPPKPPAETYSAAFLPASRQFGSRGPAGVEAARQYASLPPHPGRDQDLDAGVGVAELLDAHRGGAAPRDVQDLRALEDQKAGPARSIRSTRPRAAANCVGGQRGLDVPDDFFPWPPWPVQFRRRRPGSGPLAWGSRAKWSIRTLQAVLFAAPGSP